MTNKKIQCFLVEKTGEMTPFHEGMSSPIMRRLSDGALFNVGWTDHPNYPPLPYGAMWMEERGLTIRTPGGDWYVDQPSTRSGVRWTRTGELPHITVRASISFNWDDVEYGDGQKYSPPIGHRNYHAVLTNGVLEEC